uniref:Uncharacterized protein n=1 Tax=Siphoviridae sp. ct96x5 TaxID=2825367 RepID=A0A8S5PQX2_9CAUD|nr:MAG TPA: hypothetical protein [Siphoviridae sp. ct96x5]
MLIRREASDCLKQYKRETRRIDPLQSAVRKHTPAIHKKKHQRRQYRRRR